MFYAAKDLYEILFKIPDFKQGRIQIASLFQFSNNLFLVLKIWHCLPHSCASVFPSETSTTEQRRARSFACGGPPPHPPRTEPPAGPKDERGACQAHNPTRAKSLMQFHQDVAIGKT